LLDDLTDRRTAAGGREKFGDRFRGRQVSPKLFAGGRSLCGRAAQAAGPGGRRAPEKNNSRFPGGQALRACRPAPDFEKPVRRGNFRLTVAVGGRGQYAINSAEALASLLKSASGPGTTTAGLGGLYSAPPRGGFGF